ncbi:hypothetical protein MRX96_002529 [Rhipicephalus microplus]
MSSMAAAQPITAKQDIPAIKVSHVENVKRRSLPHTEPRKPGLPLRAQNTKAAPCAHPAVRKKAGPQPITAKQDIPAIKVSHVENVKRRSLPHAEPRKPGQPLRAQNTKAAPCAHPAVKKKAGLCFHKGCRSAHHCQAKYSSDQGVPCGVREKTKPASRGTSKAGPATSRTKHEGRAVRPPSGEKESRSFCFHKGCRSAHHCQARYSSDQGVPCGEREKTNPASRGTSKAGPATSRTKHEGCACAHPAVRKKAVLSVSTKTVAQPITAKQDIPAMKVSHVENVKRRSLPHAEPRKPGQPLRAQNTKAAPCAHPAVRKKAGLSVSTKAATQPNTAKQDIPAIKVSRVENVKRRSLPDVEPRKPGQPLRPQNTKAAPCAHPAVRKKAGLSVSTKAATQPITAKQDIPAIKVSHVENVKRRSLPHPDPRKPGQPLRARNTKAALCAHPAVRKKAGLSVSTKAAVQPITAKQDIPAIKVSHVENVKRRSLPHAEPRKPGQPLRAQNTKAAPCAHPAVRKKAAIKVSHAEYVKRRSLPHAEPRKPGQLLRAQNTKAAPCAHPAVRKKAGLSVSTKAAAQPITAKQDIPAIKVSHVENVKKRILPHAEPRKPGQLLRAQNTKVAPCAHPAVRKKAVLSVSTKTVTQPITAKQDIPAMKVSHVENVKRRSLPHAEPRKPGQPLRAQNTKAAPCAHPAVRKKAGLSVSTKAATQPNTAKQDIPAIKVSRVENVKRRSLPDVEPRKPGQPLRPQNTKAAPCAHPAVRKKAGLSLSTKAAAQPITAKQDIPAIKVSHVENVKRRSLPHPDPRKPGQPLREQNPKAAPCAHPAVRKKAGLSVSTKAAAQPIIAKQDIPAIKVSHVKNIKRRSLCHAEPRKPGQPLRTQNTTAAPCAHPAVRKKAGLSVSTKAAVQPVTAKQDIPGIKVSHVENVKDEACLTRNLESRASHFANKTRRPRRAPTQQ